MLIPNMAFVLFLDVGNAPKKLTQVFAKKTLARLFRVLLTSKNKTNYVFGISMKNTIKYHTACIYFKCNMMKGLGYANPCTSRDFIFNYNVNFLAPTCHDFVRNRVLLSTYCATILLPLLPFFYLATFWLFPTQKAYK